MTCMISFNIAAGQKGGSHYLFMLHVTVILDLTVQNRQVPRNRGYIAFCIIGDFNIHHHMSMHQLTRFYFKP